MDLRVQLLVLVRLARLLKTLVILHPVSHLMMLEESGKGIEETLDVLHHLNVRHYEN